ncbi:MAG TPA: hypothetical protein VI056_13570 [Candidatus Limnocylindria bacterium]
MRWLPVALVLAFVACEPRVVVTRSGSPQVQPAATASGATPSASGKTAPPKIALRPIPSVTPPSRLLSSEQASDIPVTPLLRFLMTDDGRVITQDASGQLLQRKLTPTGTATMLLQAIQTGLFDKDASYPRVPVPGTTPPGRGPTFLILTVANAGREVRVSFEPTGQPDDEQYQKSTTREKLTALARGYEDLSWVATNLWADSRQQPYQPVFQRLFILAEPNQAPVPYGRQPDADAIWPFLTPIDAVGGPMSGTLWRCAVMVDEDAQLLGDTLTQAGAARRDRSSTTAALTWHATGSVRLVVTPLMPHESASCAGAAPPLF